MNEQKRTWEGHYRTARGRRWWPNEELVRSMSGKAGCGRVLDVGCGNGANLWMLREHTHSVIGIDILSSVLHEARQYFRARTSVGGCAVAACEIARLPFAGESFDGVVDVMTSQHIRWSEHETAYREYRRVLKPGGFLFVLHLDDRTSGKVWSSALGLGASSFDATLPDLFPDAGLVCLPSQFALALSVTKSGFDRLEVRGVAKERGVHCAHYTIVEARAA